jgi:hypothetical protein
MRGGIPLTATLVVVASVIEQIMLEETSTVRAAARYE